MAQAKVTRNVIKHVDYQHVDYQHVGQQHVGQPVLRLTMAAGKPGMVAGQTLQVRLRTAGPT